MFKKTIFIVKKDSPAIELVRRKFLGKQLRPGTIIQASQEELDSWRTDVEVVSIDEPEPGRYPKEENKHG